MLGDVARACRHAPAPLGQQGDRCPLEGDGLRKELGQVRAQLEPAGRCHPLEAFLVLVLVLVNKPNSAQRRPDEEHFRAAWPAEVTHALHPLIDARAIGQQPWAQLWHLLTSARAAALCRFLGCGRCRLSVGGTFFRDWLLMATLRAEILAYWTPQDAPLCSGKDESPPMTRWVWRPTARVARLEVCARVDLQTFRYL